MNRIETTDIHGNNRVKLLEYHNIDIHPFDIGISGDNLYWTDWVFPKLTKMDRYAGRTASLTGPSVFQWGGGVCIGKVFLTMFFKTLKNYNVVIMTLN